MVKLKDSGGGDEAEAILYGSAWQIDSCYTSATARGLKDIFILVADIREPWPQKIARRLLGDERVDAQIAGTTDSQVPVMIIPQPRQAFIQNVGAVEHKLRTCLAHPAPPGKYHVLAIAGEGWAHANPGLPQT